MSDVAIIPGAATTTPYEEEARGVYGVRASSSVATPQFASSIGFDFGPDVNITLNPEMIIAMARGRLRDMDQQIAANMEQLQHNTDRAGRLTDQQKALNDVISDYQERSGTDDSDVVPIREHRMPDGKLYIDYLEEAGFTGLSHIDEGETVTLASLRSHLDGVKTELRKANSGNELLMMTIQTLTQQRSQIIQLSTNLIQKLDEASSTVARNI